MRQALDPFLRSYPTTAERIVAIETALSGEGGKVWRDELAKWTVRMVPVELLVPEVYAQWRPLVRDSMMFVVSRLSPSRLAPKIVEQMELAADTPPEDRLLRFIAKVPGLQKIGQVLARNRNLDPKDTARPHRARERDFRREFPRDSRHHFARSGVAI